MTLLVLFSFEVVCCECGSPSFCIFKGTPFQELLEVFWVLPIFLLEQCPFVQILGVLCALETLHSFLRAGWDVFSHCGAHLWTC